MSENGHCKRTRQALEALGFYLDEEASSRGKWIYRHPNAPEKRLGVFSGISEIAARKVRNAADEIAGYSMSGERIPASVRDQARVKRQSARQAEQAKRERESREREPIQRRMDAQAEQRRKAAELERQIRHDRAIADLMRPGNGR